MPRFLLSKAAASDLEEIDAYTLEIFGLGQAVKLRGQFREKLESLAENPLSTPGRVKYDPPGKTFR